MFATRIVTAEIFAIVGTMHGVYLASLESSFREAYRKL